LEYNGTVHQLFRDSEKAFDSGEKYCILFPQNLVYMKLVKLIKKCLNEKYSEVYMDKNLMHFLFRMV